MTEFSNYPSQQKPVSLLRAPDSIPLTETTTEAKEYNLAQLMEYLAREIERLKALEQKSVHNYLPEHPDFLTERIRRANIQAVLARLTQASNMLQDVPRHLYGPGHITSGDIIQSAIYALLLVWGPLHRKDIYQLLTDCGVVVGGVHPLDTLSSYLSRDPRFQSSGHGVWRPVGYDPSDFLPI